MHAFAFAVKLGSSPDAESRMRSDERVPSRNAAKTQLKPAAELNFASAEPGAVGGLRGEKSWPERAVPALGDAPVCSAVHSVQRSSEESD